MFNLIFFGKFVFSCTWFFWLEVLPFANLQKLFAFFSNYLFCSFLCALFMCHFIRPARADSFSFSFRVLTNSDIASFVSCR
jgi:hypothetical protein